MSEALTTVCRCGKLTEVVARPEDGIHRFGSHGGCLEEFARVDWDGDPKSEGRFTEPRAECPMPSYWHSDDMDSTEREVSVLVAAWVTALQPEVVVETGAAWGQTAEAIGKALQRSGHGVLHTLEPDAERASYTRDRCSGLPVVVEERKSLDFTPPAKVGFAWLDSLLDLRVPEFHHLRPYLSPGAFVGFHDTGIHHGPLRSQIEELETQGLLLPVFLGTPRGVCFAEVVG